MDATYGYPYVQKLLLLYKAWDFFSSNSAKAKTAKRSQSNGLDIAVRSFGNFSATVLAASVWGTDSPAMTVLSFITTSDVTMLSLCCIAENLLLQTIASYKFHALVHKRAQSTVTFCPSSSLGVSMRRQLLPFSIAHMTNPGKRRLMLSK